MTDSTRTTLDSPVLVVTGAGSGIGRAVAVSLASRPETLVLVGRRRGSLEETAAALVGQRTGPPPVVVDADLSTTSGTARLGEAVGDRAVAGLALVAGGVGASSGRDGLDGVVDSWDASWRTNVLTAVLTVEVLRDRLAEGAAVVAFGSIAATRGGGAYGATKAALTPWVRDLARALGPRGITANVVAPGYTEGTEFFGPAIDPARRARLLGEAFNGRAGCPEEVAALVAHLMSARRPARLRSGAARQRRSAARRLNHIPLATRAPSRPRRARSAAARRHAGAVRPPRRRGAARCDRPVPASRPARVGRLPGLTHRLDCGAVQGVSAAVPGDRRVRASSRAARAR